MRIPLHIEMIATCLQTTFENYVDSGSSDILTKLGRELNLCFLYTQFIEIKFTDIYIKQKILMDPSKSYYNDNNFLELFEESHTRLALYSIFDKDVVKLLLSLLNQLILFPSNRGN